MLSNPCKYLDESKSMRLQLTHILAISTSPSLYTMVVEDKEAQNHSNISFDKFYIKLHDCHFGYTSALPCEN